LFNLLKIGVFKVNQVAVIKGYVSLIFLLRSWHMTLHTLR